MIMLLFFLFLINIEQAVLQPASRHFRIALLTQWLENKSLGWINDGFILGPYRKLLFLVSSLHREKRLLIFLLHHTVKIVTFFPSSLRYET